MAETALIKNVISASEVKINTYGALRVIRNNLAHGNRGYDASDLHAVTVILDKVTRAHTLRALGCEMKIQQRVFGKN